MRMRSSLVRFASRALLAGPAFAALLAAQTPGDCHALRRRGKLGEAQRCYQALSVRRGPADRAEGLWGLRRYEEANDQFRQAVAAQPKDPGLRVRWGRLFLERFNKEEAANVFQEALQIDANHPGALLGLALLAAESFEQKAVEFAEKALQHDPKLLEARELLARLALEENNTAKATEEALRALEISSEGLDAMALLATIDLLVGRRDTEWLPKIFWVNPAYGEAYAIAARFFVLNRRYEEGIEMYRKAVELSPDLWHAHSELGVNLMRLAIEDQARKHLELAYQNGHRDAATVNTLRLMDSYRNFETHRTSRTAVRLHKKESRLLRPYFEEELRRAITALERKYQMRLERPVQLEIYPDHEDFAVRTMGMPGLGALGVTFGHVVAMDSPSAREPGTFHWASTLWHELSHVFTLAATSHCVPRWFTEGMAVFEETQVSPEWGDRLDPPVIEALAGKKLLPVEQLDRGFVRPAYPAQVVVSYYQAGKTCEFIAETWGFEQLLEMLKSFAARTTAETLETVLRLKPEEFDTRFFAWLEERTKDTVRNFDDWKKRMKNLTALARSAQHDQVIAEGNAARDLFPEYVEQHSAYELIAEAYLAKGDKKAAEAEFSRYMKAGGRSPETLKKLAALLAERGAARDAALVLDRLNYIYPNDEDLHRRLGDLWMKGGEGGRAVREYSEVLAMQPQDVATSHFNLARAFRQAGQMDQAEEHLFLALEAAPGYRAAQQMLLELSGGQTKE